MAEQEPTEILKQKFSEYALYIDDIRKRVVALVICFIIFFIAGFFSTNWIIKWIIKIITVDGVTVVTTSPFQLLNLAMSVGLSVGLFICIPIAIFLFYDFLKDALSGKEKRFFFLLLPISIILFLLGFAYGFVILYFCLGLIANINIGLGVKNYWDIDLFLSQMISTSVLLGAVFEYPIALTFLIKIKVISIEFLKYYRRHAIAVIVILVSMLPPTDGLSLIIMSVPLIVMYELTIIMGLLINKKGRSKNEKI